MIESLHKQGKSRSVSLIHCVPGKDHAAYIDQMQKFIPENQFLNHMYTYVEPHHL
jgi:ferredoxin-NADP reductase